MSPATILPYIFLVSEDKWTPGALRSKLHMLPKAPPFISLDPYTLSLLHPKHLVYRLHPHITSDAYTKSRPVEINQKYTLGYQQDCTHGNLPAHLRLRHWGKYPYVEGTGEGISPIGHLFPDLWIPYGVRLRRLSTC